MLDENGKKTDETATISVDEGMRETTLEGLAGLKPVARPDGVHTAGSSSQISDGAGAVLMTTAERAEQLGLTPRARVAETCLVGCDPVLMLEGPIPATHRLLERANLSIEDIDVVEINEAFASVVLCWAAEHEPDMERVNPNGGAIALGHPLGGTGSILGHQGPARARAHRRPMGPHHHVLRRRPRHRHPHPTPLASRRAVGYHHWWKWWRDVSVGWESRGNQASSRVPPGRGGAVVDAVEVGVEGRLADWLAGFVGDQGAAGVAGVGGW